MVMYIEKGSKWRHKKTGRIVAVGGATRSGAISAQVRLIHSSGRETYKRQHDFLYEYERISDE